jgi:hypothetical protein
MDYLNAWYIEAKKPLPPDICNIFKEYSISPATTIGNSMSLFTFGIPHEEIPMLTEKVRDIMEQNNICPYVIRTTEYIATDECQDIESEGWYEEPVPVSGALLPDNNTDTTASPVCNFALEVIETRHRGYIEDESAWSETTRKIVLLPADDDTITNYETSLYEDQDFSYQVKVKRIGILDLPGERLTCDDDTSNSAIIVRQYSNLSLEELQEHAEKYDPEKPIILTSGPVVIKNLHCRN